MNPDLRKRILDQLTQDELDTYKAGMKRAKREGWADMVRGPQDIFALAEGCYFDHRYADHAQRFFEKGLVHATGRWAGKPFILQDWQRDDVLRPLFGWRRPDGSRRHRSGFIRIAKKNGKSTFAGGLINYVLAGEPDPDNHNRTEQAQEVYAIATSAEVASIVYREASKLCKKSPLLKRLKLETRDQTRRILYPKTQSFFRVLPHKADSAEGMIAGGLIVDEEHAMKSRALYDAVRWSGSSRRQMLAVEITTSGIDDKTLLWCQRDAYSKRVRDGEHRDTSHLVAIYEADVDAKLDDVEQLRKANPSLGVTINEDDLVREARQVMGEGPEAISAFKRYRMNIAVGAEKTWLSREQWDKAQTPFDESKLIGRQCYGGLDLAKVSDFTALLLLWPPDRDPATNDYMKDMWYAKLWLWLPKAAIQERVLLGDMSYQSWADAGLIEVTDGNTTDYKVVRKRINEICSIHKVIRLGIDRNFDGWQFCQDLFNDDELPAVGIGQGWRSQDIPMQRVQSLYTDALLNCGGHPIMRWMIGNAVAKREGTNECLSLDRKNSKEKIDGVAALINATYLAEAIPEEEGPPEEYSTCPLV